MRKLIGILLTVALCLGLLAGCSVAEVPTEEPTQTPTQAPTAPPNPPGPSCKCGRAVEDGDNTWCAGDCDGVFLDWQDLDQSVIDSLSVEKNRVTLPDGSYCLSGDITLKDIGFQVSGQLVIDLNGFDIRYESAERSLTVFELGESADLTILDNTNLGDDDTECGVIYPDPESTLRGSIISSRKGGTFTLYGGKLDASAITKTDAHGPTVLIIEKSVMKMHGGTIVGAHTTQFGGGVYVNSGSAFVMTGGQMYGGRADLHGNNLYIGDNDAGIASLSGGTIYGGFSTASGDVSIGGTLKILGQTKDGYLAPGFYMRRPEISVTIIPCREGAFISFDASSGTVLATNVSESDLQYFEFPYGFNPSIQDGKLSLIPDY